ncbi:MAG: hypothetical protein Q9190_002445 [Brigantiaea leucoxantha]
MSQSTQSLLDYLRLPNPRLSCKGCRKGSNTASNKASYRAPKEIAIWEDFELSALKAINGGLLKAVLEQHYSFRDHSDVPGFPFRQIYDENSLEALLIKWNWSVVSEALFKAQMSNRDFEPKMFMVRGGQATYPESVSQHTDKKRLSFRPDWAGIQRHVTSKDQSDNILPGETKLSSKWGGHQIQLGDTKEVSVIENWFKPIIQIFTYCIQANARYGYLITDKELVVVRVRPRTDTRSSQNMKVKSAAERAKDSGILEFHTIPWTTNTKGDPNSLTVNLTLWYLHMIAARGTEIKDHYPPLGELKHEESFAISGTDEGKEPSNPHGVSQGTEPDDIGFTRDTRLEFSDFSIEDRNESTSPTFGTSRRKRTRGNQLEDRNQDKKQKRRQSAKDRRRQPK